MTLAEEKCGRCGEAKKVYQYNLCKDCLKQSLRDCSGLINKFRRMNPAVEYRKNLNITYNDGPGLLIGRLA